MAFVGFPVLYSSVVVLCRRRFLFLSTASLFGVSVMNNAHVFIARLVRAPAQKTAGVTVGDARSVLSGRVFELPFAATWLPSLASGFLRSCRNDGGGRSRS